MNANCTIASLWWFQQNGLLENDFAHLTDHRKREAYKQEKMNRSEGEKGKKDKRIKCMCVCVGEGGAGESNKR